MTLLLFTVEEENLICIYDMSSRDALNNCIVAAIPHFVEPELREIAESALRKIKIITDSDFASIVFHPAYHGDDEDIGFVGGEINEAEV